MAKRRAQNVLSARRFLDAATGRTVLLILLLPLLCHAGTVTREGAAAALRQAVRFFSQDVSSHGGYLWRYSGDLSLREAEGRAGRETVWVQPPGTPAVGAAFLDAYEATRESLPLEAARAAAEALLRGQLHSGGWPYRIEFDPAERSKTCYRYDMQGRRTRCPVTPEDREGTQGWHIWKKRKYKGNVTILDDDTTQAALRFLMRLDRLLGFEDGRLHEAVTYGLDSLLKAQYPNGAWSHNYDRLPGHPPDTEHYPVRKASCPTSWPAKWPKQYAGCYVINDAITPRAIETMLCAWETYGEERYLQSALRGGDFLLLAQMPRPQPAWAQQYDRNMHPVWDRAFEPPAVTGGESQTVLETLLLLCRATGKEKYAEPIPSALVYLRRSALPDGRLARFYELRTNRPIYFTRDAEGRHQPTYEQERLATNYAFVVDSRLDAIEAEYRHIRRDTTAGADSGQGVTWASSSASLEARVAAIVKSMDVRGAWVEQGRLRHHHVEPPSGIIDGRTFIDNVGTLCAFLRAEHDR
jgi:hypothetical protein